MTALEIKPAVREKTHILASLAGPSGSGKTYSALLMARGIVGPEGKIGFLDTEAKRARHYADLTPFDVMDMSPPFSPLRYLEAVKAFAEAGYKVLVIDSISHVWEGTGGCIEMAEGGKGLLAWQRPKAEHKKLMNYLLQVPMHVIFCARAREKMVQVRNRETGKDEIVNQGWHAIAEKNFIFEMTVSMILDEKTKIPELTKCPDQLLHAFPEGQKISTGTGAMLRQWAEQGVSLDQAFEDLKHAGREAADLGIKHLREWYIALPADDKARIKPILDGELKSIAEEADRRHAEERKSGDDDPFGTPVHGVASHAGVSDEGKREPVSEPSDEGAQYVRAALRALGQFETVKALENWWANESPFRGDLTPEQVTVLETAKDDRRKKLSK